MLCELSITGLGVIDGAVLEPHPGLTVVTGETGAGKTMVVTALGLISGRRADSSRVRSGSPQASVEARVLVPQHHSAVTSVESAGGRPDEDGSLILARTVFADGRSRAHAGGRSIPLASLSEISESLVAVHGQFEAISLLQPSRQRAVLDRYARTEAELAAYREVRSEWQAAVADLAERTHNARERALREQVLRAGIAEVDRVGPKPGEDADLNGEVRRLENVDGLRAVAAQAIARLSGDDTDPVAAVALVEYARKALDGAEDEKLKALGVSLHQASAVLVDVAADLGAYLDALDADPARLDEALTRQSTLKALTRRYGTDLDEVLAWRESATQELLSLDSSEEALAALARQCQELAGRVAAAATALSERRAAASVRLAERAGLELADLAMGRATLRVGVDRRTAQPGAAGAVKLGDGTWAHAGSSGIDDVEFLMTAHVSAPELPIAKGASGGERSRVMLALEVVLAEADPVSTLVFDEVDAGVGGRAATGIGRKLAALAASHQVIVVTHLAQVAAFADRHVVVDSAEDGAVRVSSLRHVEGPDREAELARMLGGTDGDVARAHAAELLAAAATPLAAPPVAATPDKTAKRRTTRGRAPRA